MHWSPLRRLDSTRWLLTSRSLEHLNTRWNSAPSCFSKHASAGSADCEYVYSRFAIGNYRSFYRFKGSLSGLSNRKRRKLGLPKLVKVEAPPGVRVCQLCGLGDPIPVETLCPYCGGHGLAGDPNDEVLNDIMREMILG